MDRPKRNPDWTEEELTLVLDVYFKIENETSDFLIDHQKVVILSEILNTLPIHPREKRNEEFRHPDGVRRRFRYFVRLEKGLGINGHAAYLKVWRKYANDLKLLENDALQIQARYRLLENAIIKDDYEAVSSDIKEIEANQNIQKTERDTLVKARVAQGKFRDKLIEYWKCCALTGCDQLDLLRASHIKPWRSSTNQERLDPYNGLLLAPNLDLLFDRMYITFDEDGQIIISSLLSKKK